MDTRDKVLSEFVVFLGLIDDLSPIQVKIVPYIIFGGWSLEEALEIVHKYVAYKEKGKVP